MIAKCKRIVAFLTTCILLLSSVTVYAAEDASTTETAVDQYTLSVESDNGNVTVTGEGVVATAEHTYLVDAGSNVTAKISASEGYDLDQVLLNGLKLDCTDDTFSFSMPDQDSVLQADYSEKSVEGETETDSTDPVDQEEVQEESLEAEQPVPSDPEDETPEEVEKSETASEAIQEKAVNDEQLETYDVTVRVHGEGEVQVRYQDQDITVTDNETLSLEPDTYITVAAKSSEKSNITMTVATADGVELEPASSVNDTAYEREVTVTRIDKVVDVTFGDESRNLRMSLSALMSGSARGTEQQPEVGDRYAGVMAVEDVIIASGSQTRVDHVDVTADSGILSTESTISLDCAQHGAAAPRNGMLYDYTYTITSVDQSSGTVSGSVYARSQFMPAEGDSADDPDYHGGYQALSGTMAIYREYSGYLSLIKSSSNPEITSGNSSYNLSGAVYRVYSDAACVNWVNTLTTNAAGTSNSVELTAGQYYVKEYNAPAGYALDPNVYPITVTAGQTATLRVSDIPQSDPVSVLLGKIDAETSANMPQGSASLENAEFTVKYYGGFYDTDPAEQGITPVRTWVLKTNSDGRTAMTDSLKVSGDDYFKDSNGYNTLPLGTITIQETKAPEGYLLNDEVYIRQITAEGTAEGVNTYNEPEIPEDIIRGDVQIAKYGESNDETEDSSADIKRPLEGVKFHFTSKTTGDTYTIVTDEQGIASTVQLGISERGNLVYDTYVVTEESPYPEYDEVEPFEVTINEENKTIYYILRNDTVDAPIQVQKVDATTGKVIPIAGTQFQILDEDKNVISMTVSHYPTLITQDTWTTDESGMFVLPEKLEYGKYYLHELNAPEGYLLGTEDIEFVVDEEYSWDNPLIVQYADEPVMGQIEIIKTDAVDGYPLAGAVFTVMANEDIVTPDGTLRVSAGEVVDTITSGFDGTVKSKELFLGKYTVTETQQPTGYVLPEQSWEVELTYEDQHTAIVTESLEAENEPTTVIINKKVTGSEQRLSGVRFTIWNKDHEDPVDPGMTYKDIYKTDRNGQIRLERLAPGNYCIAEVETVPGYAMDPQVHEFCVTADGRIEGQNEYTITIENAKTEIVATNVLNVDSGSQKAYPGIVTAVDTVSMVNLQPYTTYRLVGSLMDVETEQPVLDRNGDPVSVEQMFTATGSAMDVDVIFQDVDLSAYAGRTIVAYERLYQDDIEISAHTDPKDADQQLQIMNPELHTTAIDLESGTHEGIAKENVTIRDKVDYTDILPGTYILRGILMDQATGEPLLVDGQQVTAERRVQITDETGTVTMDFTFDADQLNNTSTVVFEYLYPEDEDTPIASHEDINDADQTVTFKVGSLSAFLPGQGGSGSLIPKTGDATSIIPYLVAMVWAGAFLIGAVALGKKKKVTREEAEADKKD